MGIFKRSDSSSRNPYACLWETPDLVAEITSPEDLVDTKVLMDVAESAADHSSGDAVE
jgi:hypothetical protein